MKANYNRSVSLQCPTCGGTQFEFDETEFVKCSRCDRVLNKEELRRANGCLIEAEVEEMKAEVLRDVKADL
ncbi:ECs_2282 family putative zinc-binding protein, partial [Staphylococcus aureus]